MKTDKNFKLRQIGVTISENSFEILKKLATIDGVTFTRKANLIVQNYINEHEEDARAYDKLLADFKKRHNLKDVDTWD